MATQWPANLSAVAASGRFYVYVLTDPRTGEPFYVGKGKGRRIAAHETEARAHRFVNPHKTQAILDIWAAGLSVQYHFAATDLSEAAALRLEREMIGQFGIDRLTNASPGGIDANTRAGIEAAEMLKRITPYDEWLATHETTPIDREMYVFISGALTRLAAMGVAA